MPTWKLTMLFEAVSDPQGGLATRRIGGWSESVYWTAMGPTTIASFHRLCRARADLLPSPAASIIGQRYQQVDPVGGSTTGAVKFPGTYGGGSLESPTNDIPQMALLCKTSTGNGNIRPTVIRCIPDSWVKGGELSPVTGQNLLLNEYFTQLAGWLMRGRDLTATTYPISSVTSGGLVSLAVVQSITVPSMVRILQTTDENGIRRGGVFKVTAQPSSSSIQLENWPYQTTVGGKVRPNAVIYPALTTTAISRVVVKKVGRPFFQYRGRRSKKRR